MKKYFVTGLAVILPLALTFWIVSFILGVLTEPFMGIAELFLKSLGVTSKEMLEIASKIFALIFFFLIIVLVGAIGRYFFFKYLIELSDALLHRIPVVSTVYKTSQELIQTVFTQDSKSFKQVVLVSFPHAGSKTLGLVTQDESLDGRMAVFIPTTPNPTSGYLLMYKREDVVLLDMKVEEALRYIISCGVLMPQIKPKSDTNKSLP